jgi:hypothetical protein
MMTQALNDYRIKKVEYTHTHLSYGLLSSVGPRENELNEPPACLGLGNRDP